MACSHTVFLPAPCISALKTGNATECSNRFQSEEEKRGGNTRIKELVIKQLVISELYSDGGGVHEVFFFFKFRNCDSWPSLELCEDETTQPGYPAHCLLYTLPDVCKSCVSGWWWELNLGLHLSF